MQDEHGQRRTSDLTVFIPNKKFKILYFQIKKKEENDSRVLD
jgi:hypothetical protein